MRGRSLLTLAVAAFACLSAAAARAQAFEGAALPGTRSLYVLDVPFLHFAPLDMAAPRVGALELALDTAYANTFSHTWHSGAIQLEFGSYGQNFTRLDAETLHNRHPQDTIDFIDAEVTRVALTGRFGLGPRLSVGLEVPYLSFSALHLDSAIESFHKAVGLADFQRSEYPRGRFQIVRQRAFGALEFDDTTPRAGLGDVTARLAYRDVLSTGTRVGADVAIKLPTGDADSYRGSGSIDVGVIAGASHRFFASRRLGFRAEAALVRPGRFRGDVPSRFDVAIFSRVLAGLDVRLFRATTVSLAVVREQSPFRNDPVGDGARASVEFVVGLAQELSRHTRASLSLTENAPRFGDAADIAVTLGLIVSP